MRNSDQIFVAKKMNARRNIFVKNEWRNAVGAAKKPKRLKLCQEDDGFFHCPVENCENEAFKSQRGCRKHVAAKHGWFYFFEKKPQLSEAFPGYKIKANYRKRSRPCTSSMPSFDKECQAGKDIRSWLCSPGGSGKSICQADQILTRIMKFARFCCMDLTNDADIGMETLEFCVNSVQFIDNFVAHLRDTWKCGNAGIISYLNALSHLLDFQRSRGLSAEKLPLIMSSEVYICRAKRNYNKEMRLEWNSTLSIEYFQRNNCWASYTELQKVIPFHKGRYLQIITNLKTGSNPLPHDLTFCTSFIVAVLFLMVKATRPMTYQYLTTEMIKRAKDTGIVDQTEFKTNTRYAFDSLILSDEVLIMLNDYIDHARAKMDTKDDFLLVCRNGNKLSRLADVFGRLVYQAIGKYIHPTRFRQIIETESMQKLSIEEQQRVSQDQKHTSQVARIHYQKLQSQHVARSAKNSLQKLIEENDENAIEKIDEPGDESENQKAKEDDGDIDKTASSYEKSRKRKKKVNFSKQEDEFLLSGIRKYSVNKWTSILNDKNFKFHPSRKASTLCVRAKSKKYI